MPSRRDRIKAFFPTDTVELYAEPDLRTTTAVVTSRAFEDIELEDRGTMVRIMARDPNLRVRAWTPYEIKAIF